MAAITAAPRIWTLRLIAIPHGPRPDAVEPRPRREESKDMAESPNSRYIAIVRRARDRAIERGDAEGIARAERDLERAVQENANHYNYLAAEMERAEVFRALAEMGGLPRTAPEPELEPGREAEL